MKIKKILFKNILYIFSALLLVGVGFLFAPKPNDALALDTTTVGTLGEQTLSGHEYFSRKEFAMDEEGQPSEKVDSLILQDNFLYSSTDKNWLEFSFLSNGGEGGTENNNEIFNHVFYPNLDDRTTFFYFSNFSVDLTINGVSQNLNDGKYVKELDSQFSNQNDNIETFDMVISAEESKSPDDSAIEEPSDNIFSIMKDGQFVEGLYTLSLQYSIHTCTNGTSPLDQLVFSSENKTEKYSFFVLNGEDYVQNNRPQIEKGSFDHVVEVENLQQSQTAYTLYSNYSSKALTTDDSKDGIVKQDSGDVTNEDKIPYIQFDYMRFEADIQKELLYNVSSATVKLNLDAFDDDSQESPMIYYNVVDGVETTEGKEIVHLEIDKESRKATLFFLDLGQYTITLRPIEVGEITENDETAEKTWQKFDLAGVSSITKNVVVHLFGYQLDYTDFDQAPDQNNNRPTEELKDYDFKNDKFIDGADITSKFVHSKENYSQKEGELATAFTRSNIFAFINKHAEDCNCETCAEGDPSGEIKYALSPVKTNQTPLRFISNATRTSGAGKIYTTARLAGYSNPSSSVAGKLQGEDFYEGSFEGLAEGTPGKYIYVTGYRYNGFSSIEQDFRQIFFFEIVNEISDIQITNANDDSPVLTNTYINQSVKITDTTQGEKYCKDITIQVYAWDYAAGLDGAWMAGYDSNGRSLTFDDQGNTFTLENSAKYTIRLYYTNEIKSNPAKLDYDNGFGFLREQTFTIDKNPVDGITARNFQQVTGKTTYALHSVIDNDSEQNFFTNQAIAFSWNEKKSGASTWAYYRYFPLQDGSLGQYYSSDSSKVNALLEKLLDKNIFPVNRVLDLTTNDNKKNWLPYAGNTLHENENALKSQYVFTDAGLYLLDVYDAAGNHTLDAFMIDNSAPIFVLKQNNTYSIPTTPFINSKSTLYWGEYKAIYIAGLKYENFNMEHDGEENYPENIDDDFFKTRDGKYSKSIYKLVREKLFDRNKIQHLNPANGAGEDNLGAKSDGVSSLIDKYDGLYLTVKINETSYYNETTEFIRQTNVRSKEFAADSEMTYTILIRDESNSKRFLQWDQDALDQYTTYYSAKQTIIVSFDTSEFYIQYVTTDQYGNETINYLTSNNTEKRDPSADEGNYETLMTYLSPTRLNKPLVVTFKPTGDENKKIQVQSVSVTYYEFKAMSRDVVKDGKTTKYWYYGFSNTPSGPENYYEFKSGSEQDNQTKQFEINLDDYGMTKPGKYEITRTYMTEDDYTHNPNDYTTRIYTLIVDRNDVISNRELVHDSEGHPHNEDLVGGDMFVAMYDTGENLGLVVTFPNSDEGNTDGTIMLQNSQSSFTTNKLPVNVYIPQFKYTTYVEKQVSPNGYEFEVKYDFANGTVSVDDEENPDTMNYYNAKLKNMIREYALYAEIYKDNISTSSARPYAVTSKSATNPTFDNVRDCANSQGFLDFYLYGNSSQKLEMLYEPGTYYVRIYQGRFGTETGENQYLKTYDFCFDIQKTDPDFDIRLPNGSELYSSNEEDDNVQTYYTNQSILEISWEISKSKFMAEIDRTKIKFSNGNVNFTYDVDNDKYSSGTGEIWITKPEPTQNGTRYTGQLNLQSISGAYANNGYVDITMQYENHDAAKIGEQSLYKTVKKRILVDLCAPNRNINDLVSKSLNENAIEEVLNTNALRTYKTAVKNTDGSDTTTDLNITSYNISNSSEQNLFKNFSYSVDKTFLQNLKQNEEAVTAYVRSLKVADVNTKYFDDTQETSPEGFHETDFVLANTLSELETDTYYEIVELDYARNMSIYTIYVADFEKETDLISYTTENGDELSYKTSDFMRVASSSQNSIHNIYARTGFKLKDINFFGDEWARASLTTFKNGVTSTINFVLTPYDDRVQVIKGDSIERVSISDLIYGQESSSKKHTLKIYDRVSQTNQTFYFTILNSTLTSRLTDVQTQELINFAYVSDAQIQDKSTFAAPFVVGMKISVNGSVIYGERVENDSYAQVKNPIGYASGWRNFTTTPTSEWLTDELVRVYVSNQRLYFEVNPNFPTARNARIEYEFTDNFGVTYNEIHIFRETVINNEVVSENEKTNPVYAYYDASATLHYVIQDSLQYNFNASKYHPEIYYLKDGAEIKYEDGATNIPVTVRKSSPVNGVSTWTFRTTHTRSENYRDEFVIRLFDYAEFDASNGDLSSIKFKKEIFFTLLDQLSKENTSVTEANRPGQFQLKDVNGNLIRTEKLLNGTQGYYSQVVITYTPLNSNDVLIPMKFLYRTEDSDWQELTSGTRLQNTTGALETYYLQVWYDQHYLANQLENYSYVFEYVPTSQIFQFNLSALTANYWVEKTVDGITSIVPKAEHGFKSKDGKQNSNHYIVNVSEDGDSVEIKVNDEQNIQKELISTYENGEVKTEIYFLTNRNSIAGKNIPLFETTIAITYVPNEKDFLKEFYTFNTNGTIDTSENLLSLSEAEKMLVIPKELSLDRTQLMWTKYFAIEENEISIHIMLGDTEIKPVTFSKKVDGTDFNYVYLTYSGLYKIQFTDVAGNVQKFSKTNSNGDVEQVDTFDFIFLKDVPFTVTYTDVETGEKKTALPVKQAIYNGSVTINIDPSTLTKFYKADGRPSFYDTDTAETSTYLVKRNGEEYHKEFESATSFTFDEPGYYEIAFAAISALPNVGSNGSIRQETYQFTILKNDEYKISYVYNEYSNYYVEKVVKDGKDVTDLLTNTLDAHKVSISGKTYLTELPLSFIDEKTGVGEYTITINTNNKLFTTDGTSKFTYKVKINSGTAPLRISLQEGQSTTGTIRIDYNLSNLFLEMGESTLRIVHLLDGGGLGITESVQINADTTGEASMTISTSGTYFIQVVSPSGNLLFTYKVIRNEPLNAAAIIAIVVAAVVLVAVIVIIIKLRKRISVK